MPDSPLSPAHGDDHATAHLRRERRKQDRPKELLDAALELFVEHGYAATRVEEVAARAGVSKGTLFLYFHSKEELFKAVIRENLTGRFEQWNLEFDTFQGSSQELLQRGISLWWQRVGCTSASGIAKLVSAEAAHFPELATFYQTEVASPGHALIRRILERGIARGEFRVIDTHHAACSIVAGIMFAILWRHSANMFVPGNFPFDPQTFIEQHLNHLLHGLLLPVPATEFQPSQPWADTGPFHAG